MDDPKNEYTDEPTSFRGIFVVPYKREILFELPIKINAKQGTYQVGNQEPKPFEQWKPHIVLTESEIRRLEEICEE